METQANWRTVHCSQFASQDCWELGCELKCNSPAATAGCGHFNADWFPQESGHWKIGKMMINHDNPSTFWGKVPYFRTSPHYIWLCLAANLLWGRSQSEGMKFTLPAEHNVLPCLCHQPPMTTQSRSALNCYSQNMSARENPVLISCRGYLHIQVSTETKKFIEILLSSW